LLAADHSERRRLAREALAHRWSVRELEAQARSANGSVPRSRRGRRRRALHPDQAAAVEQIAEALSEALGAELEVMPFAGGYRAQLRFASIDEALDLARRLRVRRAA
jgi:hypothetical protein